MKFSQNPFSLYDFLGYLIPGMFLLLCFVNITHADGNGAWDQFLYSTSTTEIQEYLGFVIASYLTGHLLAIISSYTIERYALWKYGYPSKFLLNVHHDGFWNVQIKDRKILKYFIRTLTGIFLFPISMIDTIVSWIGLPQIQNAPLDEPVQKLVKARVSELYVEIDSDNDDENEIDAKNHDFFNLIYHYVQEHCENHDYKIYNYVALYGLMRSLALVFVVLFWVAASKMINFNEDLCRKCIFCLVSISGLGYIFFVAYRKFLRRYSQEVLLTLVVMRRGSTKPKI